MGNLKFLSYLLLPVLWLLPINAVHSQEALILHSIDGARPVSTILLDDIQRITFSDNDLSVELFDGFVTGYTLDEIATLMFGDEIITSINAPSASDLVDVVVYSLSPGEIVVECRGGACNALTRLAVFGMDGTMWYVDADTKALRATPQQTTIPISAFPPGVYLLQIETQQGTVVKKIIKK